MFCANTACHIQRVVLVSTDDNIIYKGHSKGDWQPCCEESFSTLLTDEGEYEHYQYHGLHNRYQMPYSRYPFWGRGRTQRDLRRTATH